MTIPMCEQSLPWFVLLITGFVIGYVVTAGIQAYRYGVLKDLYSIESHRMERLEIERNFLKRRLDGANERIEKLMEMRK